jgi:hypothetical protein
MANTTSTTELDLPKNGYIAFDAIKVRNLILDRLNDKGIFTDQNYIGSNLASILDIISFSFNTLMFYLNKTSTESMFTEAQLYENISRVVKLLDYKPIGYQTSTLSFQCSALNYPTGFYTIPRYSYLMVGGAPFSFNEDITFAVNTQQTVEPLSDLSNRKLLFQGVYRENPIYTAAGDANETVTINSPNILIDHFNVDVYVYETKQEKWFQYKKVPNFYSEQSYSRSFEQKLGSNFLYDITFGNDINGRKLEEGDRVAIFYLQSSGEAGIIGPGTLLQSSKSLFSSPTFAEITNDLTTENLTYLGASQFTNLLFNNTVGSTVPKDIESSDDIRKNAPGNFRSQYRLVTKDDFETFIRTNFANFVNDVKVFSNWDYTGKYLKYFNDIQVSPLSFRQIPLNHVLYADSCNFNNIYICAIPKIAQGSSLKYLLPAQKEIMLSNIQPLKTITSEITFMDPVFKTVALGIRTEDTFDINNKDITALRVYKTNTSRRAARSIQKDVETVFLDFFNPVNTKLGGVFDFSLLTSRLLTIDGVKRFETYQQDTNAFVEGLSFYMWNPSFADLDKKVVTANLPLLDFEFVFFENLQTFISKVEIVEDNSFV